MSANAAGHLYALPELLRAKEAALESVLWSGVFGFEELDALLSDLIRLGLADVSEAESYRSRSELARRQATRRREILEADRPLVEASRHHARSPRP